MTADLLMTVAILVAGFALLFGELRRIRLALEAATGDMHRLAANLAEFSEDERPFWYGEEYEEGYEEDEVFR